MSHKNAEVRFTAELSANLAQMVAAHDAVEQARIDADNARIRTELTARLDRLDDTHIDAALHWLAHEVPDAVNDALNEIGAPE